MGKALSAVEMGKNSKTTVIDEKTPLLLIAGPMFMELFLNILLNNIDTIMLSHYSENAVGAVGNANTVMFMIIILFNIIATATSVVAAQYLGAKQYEKMNTIYTLAFVVNFVIGIILSTALVMLRGTIMNILNVPEEMRPHAMTYIAIVGGGMFIQACYNVMLQILRCNGYTKIGMYVSIIINLINIVGNYIFLYGPLKYLELGVAGVAISTVVARAVAITVALVFFYKAKIGKISPRLLFPFPGKLLVKMVKIGIPSAGENLCYNMYQMFLLSLINSMGPDSVNARAYCNSIISFAMCFSNAAAMATQIIVGHLVGAGKEDAAYKRVFSTLKVSLPITIALSTANWLLSPYTLRIFTENENIIKIAFYIMLVDIFIEIGRCLNMTMVSSLKAAGDYVFPLLVGVCTMWGLGATIGYTMGIALAIGVAGVYMGTATDECIRGLIVLSRWKSRKWCGKKLVES